MKAELNFDLVDRDMFGVSVQRPRLHLFPETAIEEKLFRYFLKCNLLIGSHEDQGGELRHITIFAEAKK